MVEERKNEVLSPDAREEVHNKLIRESGFFLSDKEDQSVFIFDTQLLNNRKHESSDENEAILKLKK